MAMLAICFISFAVLRCHSATWESAEHTADLVQELARDSLASGDHFLSPSVVSRLLDQPKYAYLEKNRDDDVMLSDNEVVWFAPNREYSIGLDAEGRVLWRVNGRRVEPAAQN
ncbi:MAG: hypothetical protein R3E01_18405 [Pirellulaceae bacterium]|nr:hypothetical protein [Planctomycetales bacterium]